MNRYKKIGRIGLVLFIVALLCLMSYSVFGETGNIVLSLFMFVIIPITSFILTSLVSMAIEGEKWFDIWRDFFGGRE